MTVGGGSVVAAGAIVTEDISGGSVTAGVPARFVKPRSNGDSRAGATTAAGRWENSTMALFGYATDGVAWAALLAY